MELTLYRAAKRYSVAIATLRSAIQRGLLPAHVISVLHLRVHSKDVEAYVKRLAVRLDGQPDGRRKRAPAAAPPPPAA